MGAASTTLGVPPQPLSRHLNEDVPSAANSMSLSVQPTKDQATLESECGLADDPMNVRGLDAVRVSGKHVTCGTS